MNWQAIQTALEFAQRYWRPSIQTDDEAEALKTMIEALKDGRVTIIPKPQ